MPGGMAGMPGGIPIGGRMPGGSGMPGIIGGMPGGGRWYCIGAPATAGK